MSSMFHDLPVYDNAQQFRDGYVSILKKLLDAPVVGSVADEFSVGSNWGGKERPFRELVNLAFVVNTDHVMLDSVSRPLDETYAVGSSEWILQGRNDVASMVALNPRGEMFSSDGFTLSGAFGYRLRTKFGDQLMNCVNILKADTFSRRAIAYVGDASDTASVSKDFPCASSVHFMVRSDELIAVVTMRSQSLFGVFPYDVVNFRWIHRFVAECLGVNLGGTVFTFNSAHIYEEEVMRIENFCEEPFTFKNMGNLDMETYKTL